jgi:hypothetical protein
VDHDSLALAATRAVCFGLAIVATTAVARAQDVTGVLRQGIYTDSDRTQVIRSFAAAGATLGPFTFSARGTVDIVSSASIDVRSSPVFDAVSSASVVEMTDRRIEASAGSTWNDGRGRVIGGSFAFATESDYRSVGGGLQLSWDLNERNTTLLAGGNYNHNSIGSVVDPAFHQTMDEVGYSLGVAQVLTPSDAVRVRYDGARFDGYQASPYRAVRFGEWSAQRGMERTIVFTGTIGSPDGLPEKEPTLRVRHAAVAEWTHGLSAELGFATRARLAIDSWGVKAATLSADLRYAAPRGQLRLGYRFYVQGAADFFHAKYDMSPEHYANYTSDKELGSEVGHAASLDISFLFQDRSATGLRGQLDAQLEVLHYNYPGFALIQSRTGFLGEIGLRFEL